MCEYAYRVQKGFTKSAFSSKNQPFHKGWFLLFIEAIHSEAGKIYCSSQRRHMNKKKSLEDVDCSLAHYSSSVFVGYLLRR